ncbi:DUF192 domain-containing protein [Patescibacteria group bacterium]|nr:DUF192 domain-containing protein [Patescibacteria group bacterium]
MLQKEGNMPEPPRLPVRDRAFSTTAVFWFSLIGFALTCLILFGFRSVRSLLPPEVASLWSELSTLTEDTATVAEIQSVTIAGKPYRLEVVRTDAAREQGLSNRPALLPGTGMRFVFETPDRYTFWMKNMRFPIDIIFVQDGTIVNIANNLPYPKTSTETPASVRPPQAFTEAIELPAGDADKLGLKIGQRIDLVN